MKENIQRIRKEAINWKKISETRTYGTAQTWNGTLTPAKLDRVWSNSNSHTFPVEMKITVTLEDRLLPYNPAITLLGIYLHKGVENLHSRGNLHTDVYGSSLRNCQTLEATEMSFSR